VLFVRVTEIGVTTGVADLMYSTTVLQELASQMLPGAIDGDAIGFEYAAAKEAVVA
jgi:hypothetical protein